jgi:superkiller protein 3
VELGDYERAIELADRAIQIAPGDPRGYALKTKALVWADQPADAIPVGVAGLEVDSNYAPLYAALARAYTNIGRYQQGLSYGERAVELDPMDADAHRSYAYALIWVGRREDAIAQLEDAIAINPNLTAPYFELAINYLALDQDELAIATYERILSLQPRNARAYLRLCETYFKVGQNSQAQGYCEDALDIDPTYAAAYRQLGMVMYNRRNYEGAIENFDKCVENGSTEIQCWYLRGLAHYYLGQCDEAWTILQESLPMAEQLVEKEPIVNAIREGLRLVTVSCPGYTGRALPTPIPPTAIPPTPIGSVGG